MPNVYPFKAVVYSSKASKAKGGAKDVSLLVAPPYDVLDSAGKQRLLDADSHNVVGIDLPHTPAKEVGPASAYERAATSFRAMLSDGTLERHTSPVMFAYRQTFKAADEKTVQRSGMCVTVETVPFGPRAGGGILPHEETFSGPKEDRMALMKATRTQLSPIFGLHADEKGLATAVLKKAMASRSPDTVATTADGTFHELWTLGEGPDSPTVKAYQDALAGEDVFIADGHHRYTTGLNYLKQLEEAGKVAPDHPARRCMIVLVGMSDPGLVIWPTHRVLGGMKGYDIGKFIEASKGILNVTPAGSELEKLESLMSSKSASAKNVLGLYDFKSRQCFLATMAQADPLKERFGSKPKAWRELDVALIQYSIVEQVCQAKLNGGEAVKWAFPHTIKEVEEIGSGAETGAGGGKVFGATGAQLAVIVRPTPLEAVKDVSRANELMPQKSTFFYPKLATGLFVNPLD
jgi:uncharacterized protein (DUF1015 family)